MLDKVKKIVVIVTVFISVFMTQLLYFKFKLAKEPCGSIAWFQEYIKGQEYFLGLSYALSFAFIVFAFLKFKENRNYAWKAALSGGIFTGILWFLCFLFGCCGSPMLIVYLNLLGISGLKVPKLVLLLMTIIFVALGYIWLIKKSAKYCCGDRPCKEER